jgi:hypothetical protein
MIGHRVKAAREAAEAPQPAPRKRSYPSGARRKRSPRVKKPKPTHADTGRYDWGARTKRIPVGARPLTESAGPLLGPIHTAALRILERSE